MLGQIGTHVSKAYSFSRVTGCAHEVNLKSGFTLDLLANDPDDNMPWDFSKRHKREKALLKVKEEKPFLIIGCSPCTAFQKLFESNASTMDTAKKRDAIREELIHLKFVTQLYRIQINAGRYFLHEYPWRALSWKARCMQQLLKDPSVRTVKGYMCEHSMIEGKPALKPMGWCSNSPHVLTHMHRLCKRQKAGPAAIWPRDVCMSILRGLREQLVEDGIVSLNGFGSVCE